MRVLCRGLLTFSDARAEQEQLIAQRLQRSISDTLLVVEHPPTLSLGIRAIEPELQQEAWQAEGIEVVRADRGGFMTFHAPGQLVLYPVVFLRERKIGVREFVSRGLAGISTGLSEFGIPAEWRLQPAGVWIEGTNRKISSVGLKVHRGVTNHGFSVNISCDLAPFSRFPICGEKNTRATSVEVELGSVDFDKIKTQLISGFLAAMNSAKAS